MNSIPYADLPAWHDGRECLVKDLTVSILDLGLIHSDATYDVMAFRNHKPLELDWHIDRFMTSCRAWRLPLPYSREQLIDAVTSVHVRTGWKDSIIWISITRGIPVSGNPRDLVNCRPHTVIYAKPYQKFNGTNRARICGSLAACRVPDISIDQHHKNFVWNDLTRAQWEALDLGYDTAVVFGINGLLSEGPGFNVAIVKQGEIYTPKSNCLPGISMRIVEKISKSLNIPFHWADVTRDMVDACDDMFLTTTVGNLVTVTEYNGRSLAVSDSQKLISQHFETLYES